MERASQEVAKAASKAEQLSEDLNIPDISNLGNVTGGEDAEIILDEMLEGFGFEEMDAKKQEAILIGVLEQVELICKLDMVDGNKYRFVAEAVSKRLHDLQALAKYMDKIKLPEGVQVSFH